MASASGYYRRGDTWLHHRHPTTKLLGLALVLLSAFALPPIVLPVLVSACLLAAALTGLVRPLINALRIPLVLLTSIVVVNALFFPGARDQLAAVGPFAVTREGLLFGTIAAGRVLVAFLASVLFLFTTLADDLLESLVARGASHRLAFVVLSAVQMVPRLQSRAASILDAQQARGLTMGGSLPQRLRALIPLIGPVLLGSLLDVRERTFALEARGFGALAGRVAYRRVADPPWDRFVRLGTLLAIGLVLVGSIGGFVRG